MLGTEITLQLLLGLDSAYPDGNMRYLSRLRFQYQASAEGTDDFFQIALFQVVA